jgi:hypothetical protein
MTCEAIEAQVLQSRAESVSGLHSDLLSGHSPVGRGIG